MHHNRRGSNDSHSWSVEETEARENSVWIAHLVSTILAAGWSGFWMAIACVLLGVVATLVFVQHPSTQPRVIASAPAVIVAPVAAASDPRMQAFREEVTSLHARQSAVEARERSERTRAAAVEVAAEAARTEGERLRAEADARRVLAEQEREQLRVEVGRLRAEEEAHRALAEEREQHWEEALRLRAGDAALRPALPVTMMVYSVAPVRPRGFDLQTMMLQQMMWQLSRRVPVVESPVEPVE
jgi:hypothetical protein